MSDQPQQPAGGGEQDGGGFFPPNSTPLVFETFSGLNTEATRAGIRDDQLAWCHGFFPIGANNLRTLRGAGPSAMTSQGSANITQFWFGVIGPETSPQNIPFVMPVLFTVQTDGSVWATEFPGTGAAHVVNVLPAGSITNPAIGHVGFSQWGRNFVLIVADGTNEYWAWDGITTYAAGASVPGFTIMPTGISGTAIEVYQNRVWVLNGGVTGGPVVLLVSVAGDFTNWATSSGGGATPINDSTLRYTGVRLLSVNGFLYLFGDSEIDYISNVQVSGSPPTLTFSIQNADPDTGTPFSAAVDTFGPSIIFANPWGVLLSSGGSARKISNALDGIYNSGVAAVQSPVFVSPGWNPSSAKAIIYGKKVWMVLVPVVAPIEPPQIPYCATPIVDTTPVYGATSGALANTTATFSTALFSVWLYLPDSERGAGLFFSNQDADIVGSGGPNPGFQVIVENDGSSLSGYQIAVNAYDGSSHPIVQAQYQYTAWSVWVNILISINTATRTLQVMANKSMLTPSSITWSSSTALQNASGHDWHFIPLVI